MHRTSINTQTVNGALRLTFRRRCRDCWSATHRLFAHLVGQRRRSTAATASASRPFARRTTGGAIERAKRGSGATFARLRFAQAAWDSIGMSSELSGMTQVELTPADRIDRRGGPDSMVSIKAYNEHAFHYFLEIERKRSEMSNRPFSMMLIEPKAPSGGPREIDPATAGKLFVTLAQCVRETDFIGWYRDGRVAGAVLTQDRDSDPGRVSDVVCRRLAGALEKHFPSDQDRGLHVRVYQVSSNASWRNE